MRIARYLLWRAARGALTVVTMIAITFALYFAVERNPPVGDFFFPVTRGVPVTHAEQRLVDHLFYLDRSKPLLFVHYVSHLVRGDFGHDYTIVTPIGHPTNPRLVDLGAIGPAYLGDAGATLSILVGGAVFVLLLSVPLGAIAGSRIGGWKDTIITFPALILAAAHPMMLGLILRSAAGRVQGLPTTGYCPLIGRQGLPSGIRFAPGVKPPSFHGCGGPVDWASHLILPWLTFALLFLALYTRIIRATVSETIGEDFVRTARAKGASQRRITARHVVPFAGIRVLTMVGMEIGTAIGVCIYIEAVYGIEGLGNAAAQNLGGQQDYLDLPVLLAIVVLITLIVVVGNLVVDLFYAVLDPRVGFKRDSRRTKAMVGGVF